MPTKKVPGEDIRRLRHYKGFQQKEAATLLEITQQAISKMERSPQLTPSVVQRVIKAYGCTVADFEKLNGYPPRNFQRGNLLQLPIMATDSPQHHLPIRIQLHQYEYKNSKSE